MSGDFLSFAGIKYTDYENTRSAINRLIAKQYNQYEWMLRESMFTESDRRAFQEVQAEMPDAVAAQSLSQLCEWISRYYGKKVIILLDEYDTPMQEAYVYGF